MTWRFETEDGVAYFSDSDAETYKEACKQWCAELGLTPKQFAAFSLTLNRSACHRVEPAKTMRGIH